MIDYFDLGIQDPDTGKNLGAKYHVCDMCGARIEPDMPRYGIKMSVFASYDTLEITAADLASDHEEDIRKLVEEMKEMDPKQLEEDVAKQFNFDLCRPCRRKFIRNPLGDRGDRDSSIPAFDVDEFLRKMREE